MKERNLYKPMQDYLSVITKESQIELTFQEIENILGFELPDSAFTRQAWWDWSPTSGDHPHAKNWNSLGWYAKLKNNSVIFNNRNYISDTYIESLSLNESEMNFYKSYPRRFVSKIEISVQAWISLLKSEIFYEDNIDFLKKIYLSPNHATTCYAISILEETESSSYNWPVVKLAKRIQEELKLPVLYRLNGSKTWWRFLFWGRNIDGGKHFEWLLRPELLIALRTVFPYLETSEGNRFLDEQLNYEIASSNAPQNLTEEPDTPKEKVDTVINNGHEGYPRSRNVTYVALKNSNYSCEFNPSHQSFINKATGEKYLEAHHLIPLAFYKEFNYSLDHISNVVSLCCECHKRIHYGIDADELIKKLYDERKEKLKKAGIEVSLEQLLMMYKLG